MANLDLDKTLTGTATRRSVVATGAKVAYAAPLVAASFKLSAMGAGAVSPNGPCEAFRCEDGGLCHTYGGGILDVCACFELVEKPGTGLCLNNFYCDAPDCTSDADCNGGTCVTNTCCGLGVQRCAPPCGKQWSSSESSRSGATAAGR